MKNQLTELQNAMIRKIATSEFNGADGGELNEASESQTWADCVIESNQDKGTFTSLQNAGLVYHIAEGRDSLVGLTEAGFEYWKGV